MSSCPAPTSSSSSDGNDNATADAGGTKKSKKCIPCEGLDESSKLDLNEVKDRLNKSFPLWKLKERRQTNNNNNNNEKEEDNNNDNDSIIIPYISCNFVAKNFQSALDAINAMGKIAENYGHHPDFHLTSYRNVQIDLYTHNINGITENDFILASLLDDSSSVTINYSPKWLKDHPEAQKYK